MKYYAFALIAASLATAQHQKTTYTYDVNGRRVEGASVMADNGSGALTAPDLNGRRVPVESSETRVISDDGTTRITETVVRRYGPNGQPGPPEKIRTETRTAPDGTVTESATLYRGDLNGNLAVAERRASETRKVADATVTTTAIERPGVNGGLELAERREVNRRSPAAGASSETATVYRPDQNGRLQEAARSVVERMPQNGATVENASSFERRPDGSFLLLQQRVSRLEKNADGTERTVTDVFEPNLAGRAVAAGEERPTLREQRTVERTPTAGGAVESISIRRVSPSDPGRLGRLEKVEETVCTGKCS